MTEAPGFSLTGGAFFGSFEEQDFENQNGLGPCLAHPQLERARSDNMEELGTRISLYAY